MNRNRKSSTVKPLPRLLAAFLAMTLALSLFMTAAPREAYAASSAPAKVKIKSAVVNETQVTLKWKKAKRAVKYQVALRSAKSGWKYWKTVKKTKANKKKYGSAKYKLKVKGNKYKVYKKGKVFKYKVLKTLKKTSFTYKGKAGKTYVFAVRGIAGKKKGKWSKGITRKTNAPAPAAEAQNTTVSEQNNPNAEGLMTLDWRSSAASDGAPTIEETSKPYLSHTSFKLTKGYSTSITLKNYTGTEEVQWKSSNASLIYVKSTSGTNHIKASIVSRTASESVTITATVGGESYTATVTGRPAPSLSRTSLYLTKGYITSITLNNYNGSTDVVWSSSNTKVIIVKSTSGTHNVKATIKALQATGSATITAKAGGKSYTATVTARNVPMIKQGDMTLPQGSTKQLTIQNYSGTVTWSSSKTSVATVSSKGLVTVKGTSGTTTITAKCGSKTATCKITARKKTPEEATKYVKKTYKYKGEAMIKADVPEGWTFSVVGINASGCEPIILITDPTGKFGVYHRISFAMAKSKEAANYWKNHGGLDLIYPVPVKNYKANGYDAAGLFAGICTYSGMKSYAIEKKLGKTPFGSDILVTRATDKKGNKMRYIFCGQVNDTGSYDIYYKGSALSLATAATATTLDVWFLLGQDVAYLQAPYNDMEAWAPVLGHIFGSIEYTPECVKYHSDTSEMNLEQVKAYSKIFNDQSEKMVNDFLKYIHG